MKEGRKGGRNERRKANGTGHILCRNSLLKHDIEGKVQGKIEVARRQGRRSKRSFGCLREKTWHWKLKGESLDCTLWRTASGRS
jgi:hypothetical protein